MPSDPKYPWRPQAPPPPAQPQKPALGGTLGVVALTLGVGILAGYTLDFHSHTCDVCHKRWWHLGIFNFGDKSAHTCGLCGSEQWWKTSATGALRNPNNIMGRDSWSMPKPPPPTPQPSTASAEDSPFLSADPFGHVPSKNRT